MKPVAESDMILKIDRAFGWHPISPQQWYFWTWDSIGIANNRHLIEEAIDDDLGYPESD